jgi:UDP-GlcNAc3NAcA epimerase
MTSKMVRKRILSIVGARPQFIKLSPMAKALEGKFEHVIVHTGQHYDDAMSGVFFEGLLLPQPNYNLGVGSETHAVQTASMMVGLEEVMKEVQPHVVAVYGDTNSTLAGALVAAKLTIPIAHVEAGLRSFNRTMPEEVNRVVTDRISLFLFAPTPSAMQNLSREGMKDDAYLVGDVMLDALVMNRGLIERNSSILERLRVQSKGFYLATIHRAVNTSGHQHLDAILHGLQRLDAPVVFPVHPRTRRVMEEHHVDIAVLSNIRFIEPVGYLEMLVLQTHARKVLTDSGGVQKESYCLHTPCITLREETEWVETLEGGWNQLVGSDVQKIIKATTSNPPSTLQKDIFGDGQASVLIADILDKNL